MKKSKLYLISMKAALFLLFFVIASMAARSQSCEVTLRNDTLIDASHYYVDIYVKSTWASGDFYYSSGQYKVTFNAAIKNGGSLYCSVVPGFSDLTNVGQIPSVITQPTATNSRFVVTAQANPPNQASCSMISSTGLGTRICRVSLYNSSNGTFGGSAVAYAQALANLTVTVAAPTGTAVFYMNASNLAVLCTMTMNNTNLVNPTLNAPINTTYVLTGGTFCGGSTPNVTLSNSQTGVKYLLKLEGNPVGNWVAGTGAAIVWNTGIVAGNYTVYAWRTAEYLTYNWGPVAVSMAPASVGGTASTGVSYVGVASFFDVFLAGETGVITKWQNNFNGGGWNDIAGTAGMNPLHQSEGVIGNYQYRAVVQSGSCPEDYSTVVGVTVADYVWTGLVNTNWNDGGNWSPTLVPGPAASVIIPSGCPNFPVITNAKAIVITGNIHILVGATVTVGSGAGLTVTGTVTVDAISGLTLQSDAAGTGSLIAGAVVGAGSTTIERFIPGYTTPTSGWHLLSSPISNQAIAPNFAPGANDDMYKWEEPTDYWRNYKNYNWPTMGLAEGFLVAYQATSTKLFSGSPNTGNYTMTDITYTPATVYHGWHLLGNPYSSAVKWNDGNWALSNVQAIAKALNPGGTYTDIAANSVIPEANGVFIYVDGPVNSLTFPAAARVHDFTPWYKNGDVSNNRLKLTASSTTNNTYVEAVVGFDQNSTSNYDLNYDSHFFTGIAQAPVMYSVANGNLSTNIMPAIPQGNTIPVSFVKGEAANYTMTASGIETFAQGVTVTLEDLVAGTTQDLRVNPVYSFTSATADQENRFLLHFGGVFGVQDMNEGMISAYSWDKSIYVVNNSGKTIQSVIVYDLLGKELVSRTQIDGKTLKIDMPWAQTGYYMVKVITDQKPYSKKLFLN